MRKAMIAALAAYVGMSIPAHAADIYSGSMKDEPVVYQAPTRSWTGLYIGAGVGAGASVTDLSINGYGRGIPTLDAKELSVEAADYEGYGETVEWFGFDGIGGEGIFGTVQLGYDYQLSPSFVIGAFVDYDFSDITTDVSAFDGYFKTELELDHMWTVGGRFGWLATPDTMWYALVGYTQGEYKIDDFGFSFDVEGWTLGAGVETMLSDNWSIKGEYRFTQFDEETFGDDYLNVELEPSVHTARVVLSYRINPFERSLDSYK